MQMAPVYTEMQRHTDWNHKNVICSFENWDELGACRKIKVCFGQLMPIALDFATRRQGGTPIWSTVPFIKDLGRNHSVPNAQM